MEQAIVLCQRWHTFLDTFQGTPEMSPDLVVRFRGYCQELERRAGENFEPPSVEEDEETHGLLLRWSREHWYAELVFELGGTYTSFWKLKDGSYDGGETLVIPMNLSNFILEQLAQDKAGR